MDAYAESIRHRCRWVLPGWHPVRRSIECYGQPEFFPKIEAVADEREFA
jgi:hypothetical protein